MTVNKEVFFEMQSKFDFISYDQVKGYYDYIGRDNVLFFVDNIDNPKICAWGELITRYKFISILRINGESFNFGVSHKDYEKFYSSVIEDSKKIKIISIVNNNPYSVDHELGIRSAGFIRPMAFFASPLSIMIDLNKENTRNRQWRRQLKDAEKNHLRFIHIEEPTDEDIRVFVNMYTELSKTKGLGSMDEDGIIKLLNDKSYYLFFVMKDDEYLAGRIVYVNNNTSYDTFAANSNRSREVGGTTYFLMECIFDFLKEKGIKTFDFGRIGVGKRSSNGVYKFKSYAGGDTINYNSSWEYSNSRLLSTALSLFGSLRGKRY